MTDGWERYAAELRAENPDRYERVVEDLANLQKIDDLDPMTAAEIVVELEAEKADEEEAPQ